MWSARKFAVLNERILIKWLHQSLLQGTVFEISVNVFCIPESSKESCGWCLRPCQSNLHFWSLATAVTHIYRIAGSSWYVKRSEWMNTYFSHTDKLSFILELTEPGSPNYIVPKSKLTKLHPLIMCSVLYINYTSIKLGKISWALKAGEIFWRGSSVVGTSVQSFLCPHHLCLPWESA